MSSPLTHAKENGEDKAPKPPLSTASRTPNVDLKAKMYSLKPGRKGGKLPLHIEGEPATVQTMLNYVLSYKNVSDPTSTSVDHNMDRQTILHLVWSGQDTAEFSDSQKQVIKHCAALAVDGMSFTVLMRHIGVA